MSAIEPQGTGLMRLRRSGKVTYPELDWPQHVATFQVAGMQLSFVEADQFTEAMIEAGTPLPPPGAFIWDAGVVLAAMLGDDPAIAGKRIVELGSGTGIAGLSAAAAGAHVVLTDRSAGMALLEANIALNGLDDIAVASELLWGSTLDANEIKSHGSFDVICGSDLLYEPSNFDNLLKSLVYLSTPGKTQVLLTYPIRFKEDAFLAAASDYFDMVETFKVQDGFQAFEVAGQSVDEVWCARLRIAKKR